MPVKKYKPTSAGRRNMSVSDFGEITRGRPERSLTKGLVKKSGGRNNNGRITSYHRGGGARRRFRSIDFRRNKIDVPAKVAAIEYDPNRSCRIALLHYLDGEKRYGVRPGAPETLAALQDQVHQFVVHYDVCGTSRQCFKVLQDLRNLSVHFMLDVDGTIYQTLDLKERAWHATIANDRAVGVEIAHPGAWRSPLNADMRRWYERDAEGWRMKFPAWMSETGVRTPGFVPRPDRPEFVSGVVQGAEFHQFDFTPEQYGALARLVAGLNQALPRIRLDAPRGADGGVVDRALPREELLAFEGVVGHFHVQTNKQDPGPAFQWERVLDDAKRLRGR